MKRFLNLDLTDEVLDELYKNGFRWIRKYNERKFDYIIRVPTVGFYVEVFVSRHPDCVPIDSYKAKKMIKKLCYF